MLKCSCCRFLPFKENIFHIPMIFCFFLHSSILPPERKKETIDDPIFFINYSSFLRYPLFERHRFGNCGTCSQSSGKESGQTRSRLSFLVFFVFYCCGKRKKEEAPPLTETYDVHEFFFRGGGVENDRLNNNNNKKTHSLHQQSRFSLSLSLSSSFLTRRFCRYYQVGKPLTGQQP